MYFQQYFGFDLDNDTLIFYLKCEDHYVHHLNAWMLTFGVAVPSLQYVLSVTPLILDKTATYPSHVNPSLLGEFWRARSVARSNGLRHASASMKHRGRTGP